MVEYLLLKNIIFDIFIHECFFLLRKLVVLIFGFLVFVELLYAQIQSFQTLV